MAKMSTPAIPRFWTRFCAFICQFLANFRQNAAPYRRCMRVRLRSGLLRDRSFNSKRSWSAAPPADAATQAHLSNTLPNTMRESNQHQFTAREPASHHCAPAAAPRKPSQINHIFRRPTPFLNEKNTFTEDDGYKLLEGHREKRWTLAWARDLLRPPKPGKLVLVRHGESTWNRNATFTGWTDVDLSERENGRSNMRLVLLEAGISVDVCGSPPSRLRRAIRSSWILLKGLDAVYRPVFKSLQELAAQRVFFSALRGPHGPVQVTPSTRRARRGARPGLAPRLAEELGEIDPAPMPSNHPLDVAKDRNYADLESTPRTESLEDTMQRALPLWRERIEPDLRSGKTVLVVAHGNRRC